MNSSTTPSTWRIVGRNEQGRIVASELTGDAGYAKRIAGAWRSSGMIVAIEAAEATETNSAQAQAQAKSDASNTACPLQG